VFSVVQDALFLVCLDDAHADDVDSDSDGNVDSTASQAEADGVRVEASELERRRRVADEAAGRRKVVVRVPIVAVTASATQKYEDKSYACDMDDFVAKVRRWSSTPPLCGGVRTIPQLTVISPSTPSHSIEARSRRRLLGGRDDRRPQEALYGARTIVKREG
jgi:hypothetical protein